MDLSYILVIIVIVGILAFYAWYASSVIKKKPVTGKESLVGAKGIVQSDDLVSEGEVSINGVIWRARLQDPTIGALKKGDLIIVDRVEELTLIVKPYHVSTTRTENP